MVSLQLARLEICRSISRRCIVCASISRRSIVCSGAYLGSALLMALPCCCRAGTRRERQSSYSSCAAWLATRDESSHRLSSRRHACEFHHFVRSACNGVALSLACTDQSTAAAPGKVSHAAGGPVPVHTHVLWPVPGLGGVHHH